MNCRKEEKNKLRQRLKEGNEEEEKEGMEEIGRMMGDRDGSGKGKCGSDGNSRRVIGWGANAKKKVYFTLVERKSLG